MKRMIAALLALMLTLSLAGMASGDEKKTFAMAGYDASSSNRNWAESLFFIRMAERTGVSYTFLQFTDLNRFGQWKADLKKDGVLPDVLFKAMLNDTEIRTLYQRGVLIDLMPYINEETMPNLWALLQEQPELWTEMTLEGHVLTLPMVDRLQSNNAIWINTDWLKKLKMEVPTTADELTEVLRAFKTGDPNGNGRADEVPMTFTGLWDLRYLQHAFGLNMNDYYLTADENGIVSSPVTSDANRRFLEWLHLLWEEGLIDISGFTTLDTSRQITDSNATMIYGVFFGPSVYNMVPQSAAGSYSLLMPLRHDGKQVYRSLLGSVTRGSFAVTSACEDPKAVLRWVDYLYSEKGCFLARCGEKDKEYEVLSDGTWRWKVSAENLEKEVIRPATIADGAAVPGYAFPDYWLKYDDADIHNELTQLSALAEIATEPCPQVMLTEAEAARLAMIWPEIGIYCENQMTHFVTGDEPLNDQTWAAFCEKMKELGMDEVVAIWQGALQREGGSR